MAENLPEQNELVLATIKKILPYGAFCSLPEYKDLEAFLHVSEVAPRWIKNIHEFISEGQRLVVKVYHVDRQKNQVDVSLKRVNEEERRRKLEQASLQKRAEKLLQYAIVESKAKLTYDEAKKAIEDVFGDVFSCFQSAFEDEKSLDELKIPAALKTSIIETAKKNIKKAVFEVSGIISLVCHGGDGIERLKQAFGNEGKEGKSVLIHYLGAPRYKISISGESYKQVEKLLSTKIENIKGFAQKNNCDFSFERSENE